MTWKQKTKTKDHSNDTLLPPFADRTIENVMQIVQKYLKYQITFVLFNPQLNWKQLINSMCNCKYYTNFINI